MVKIPADIYPPYQRYANPNPGVGFRVLFLTLTHISRFLIVFTMVSLGIYVSIYHVHKYVFIAHCLRLLLSCVFVARFLSFVKYPINISSKNILMTFYTYESYVITYIFTEIFLALLIVEIRGNFTLELHISVPNRN